MHTTIGAVRIVHLAEKVKLKTTLTIISVALLSVFAGCDGAVGGKKLFSVDFQEGQTLRYKFVSTRDIKIDWGSSKAGKRSINKSSESVNMVVAYTPIEVDPYGLTTIKATCEKVKAHRSNRGGRARTDAVESFAGKTFTFTIDATGRIEDYSRLEQLIREVGKKAFRSNTEKGRIKEPDMIGDFTTTQWFLWDSISSIEKPVEGVAVGQSWKSKLFVPASMVLRKARDVTYTLDEIRQTEKGQIAVIRSSYQSAKSVPRSWPMPYSGRFQMSGTFGFLRNYKVLDLKGEGEELFNIDAGRIEQYNQNYQMKLDASFMIPLGDRPKITIKQNLTMQLLGEPATSAE